MASRPAGYHSAPHVHDCDQLNYLQEGKLWLFIEQHAFHLQAGDFLRVPAVAVHCHGTVATAPGR